MLFFACFVISSKPIMGGKGVVMHLLVRGSEIGGRIADLMFMLETIIVFITNAWGLAKI